MSETQFLDLWKRISQLNETVSLLYWDLRTGAPEQGVDARADLITTFSKEVFELETSDEMGQLIVALLKQDPSTLSHKTVTTLHEAKRIYDRNKLIPKEEYVAYVTLQAKAETVWEKAKHTNDWNIFAPYLEQLVAYNRKFISYWGYENHPYDTLLDQYEPGITVADLDQLFAELGEGLRHIITAVQNDPKKVQVDFLHTHVPTTVQHETCKAFLNVLGYDFKRGRLDATEHPFQVTINSDDVRVTTRYKEDDVLFALLGTIHECGHAIYEQNVSTEWRYTPISSGASMGIHESQSLFYENVIGRNEEFWKHHLPLLQEKTGAFKNVTADEFYRAINVVKPSLIRIEADEVTYPLHIIVRYEIEKGLFDGTYEVADLPRVWNEKMKEYLGIVPSSYAQGVLQDVHWAGGSFGYFPSYALGYMYAAQLFEALKKDVSWERCLRENNLTPVREWLTEHIHQWGKSKQPKQLMKEATNESLSPQPLLHYLHEKYSKLYSLS